MDIPKFTQKPGRNCKATPDRIVAAIRWDYEVGMLSMAQCAERYGSLVKASTVRDICSGRTRPDIKASRFVLLWR